MICKFINPDAAEQAWGQKHPELSGFTPENELLDIIAQNRGLDPEELRDKLKNPKDYDENLDTIERVE